MQAASGATTHSSRRTRRVPLGCKWSRRGGIAEHRERIPDPESALCANRPSPEKSAGDRGAEGLGGGWEGEAGAEILCRYRLSNDDLNRDGSSRLRVTFRARPISRAG
jgi:hypothetical protein